jgi:hypothetical protein
MFIGERYVGSKALDIGCPDGRPLKFAFESYSFRRSRTFIGHWAGFRAMEPRLDGHDDSEFSQNIRYTGCHPVQKVIRS